MWTDILWPFAVVAFEALVFVITLYLTRAFMRSHDAEWSAQETPPSAAVEATAQEAAPPRMVAPEPAVHGREPRAAA